jgi:hypothetical protein
MRRIGSAHSPGLPCFLGVLLFNCFAFHPRGLRIPWFTRPYFLPSLFPVPRYFLFIRTLEKISPHRCLRFLLFKFAPQNLSMTPPTPREKSSPTKDEIVWNKPRRQIPVGSVASFCRRRWRRKRDSIPITIHIFRTSAGSGAVVAGLGEVANTRQTKLKSK